VVDRIETRLDVHLRTPTRSYKSVTEGTDSQQLRPAPDPSDGNHTSAVLASAAQFSTGQKRVTFNRP